MKWLIAVVITLAVTAWLAFAQDSGSPDTTAGESTKVVASLKLASVNGDTFDIARLKQPLVLLVANTDSASEAAAEAVEHAFAAATEPAMYFAVIEAEMKQARTAAGKWELGYVVLSDSGQKVMQWLSANVPAKVLSPKAGPPLVAFMDEAGKVIRVDSSITEAGVIEGVKAMSKTKETMVDPVCGMTISRKTAAATYDYQGKTYYFCSKACKDSLAKDPQKYLAR